jgi:formamidase
MGIKGIRTALKVDLEKPARDQPGLHVRISMQMIKSPAMTNRHVHDRIVGTQMVCREAFDWND